MKVLILTNSSHERFVGNVVREVGGTHLIMTHRLDEKFSDYNVEYDTGISFMYQHKVPAKEVNSRPWFNFHPAPLPEYKGRNLCYWALMNGEKEFGATLHYMTEEYDAGDIINVRKFPISPVFTAQDVSDMAIAVSKDLFVEYLPRILAGEQFERHPNKGGIYYRKNKPPILDEITLSPSEPMCQWIRAVTYKDFYPKLVIGGETYKIVKE